jgi:putative transposase
MRRLRSKFLETGMRTYATDLTEAQWALVDSIIPEGKPGGRPRSIDVRAAVNAIFYLLRTGCQWRLLPREFPPWPTVYYYFRRWEQESVWLTLLRSLYPLTRLKAGRCATPSVAIMDGQSVKTTEKGAFGVLTPTSGSREENDISWSIR